MIQLGYNKITEKPIKVDIFATGQLCCVGGTGSGKSIFVYEERYHPKTGQGLILIDGQEIQPIQIPFISDKERLKKLLQEMAKR